MSSSFIFGAFDMNETAIQKVINFIDEFLFEPTGRWPVEMFEERAYSRWAANEIIQRLLDCPFDAPEEVISRFIFEMSMNSHMATDEKKQRIFQIASETAMDILIMGRLT